jgi:hypothetical protein
MKKFVILVFLIAGALLAVSILYDTDDSTVLDPAPPADEPLHLTVSFSHEEFFYNETIYVSISVSKPDAAVYFTVDGSDPAENGEPFTQPLEFAAEESVRCVVLKAIAITDNAEQSPVLTHTYFIGYSVEERFSTYVFSISADNEQLFGDERGILVPGRIAADYIRANPNTNRALGHRPANYNQRGREWERLVYVEAFTQDGERVISQNAGIRVHGGATRRYPQKSLRLIARQEYERGAGSFNYNFFEGYTSACMLAAPITSHQTLVLRNDGNDFLLGRMRTPLASKIAKNAGFLNVSPQAAAVIFINGEIYGFAWINIRANAHFFENLYGAPQRSFDIIQGGSTHVETDSADIREEFEQLLRYAQQDNIDALGAALDIDNFLLYYAIQAYSANTDWPQNNMKLWRYTGDLDADNLLEALDGRWRYIFYDIDRALGRDSGTNSNHRSITRLLDGRSPIFNAVMRHPQYVGIFANYICDLAMEHFSDDAVRNLVQEINDISLGELAFATIYGLRPGMSAEPNVNPYWEERGFNFDMVMADRERVTNFAARRGDLILNELRALFGYTSMYRIISDGSAKINSLNGNEGVYFIENRVPVFPVLEKGHEFDHWLVNGGRRYEEDLLISFKDADADGVVYVRLVTVQQ